MADIVKPYRQHTLDEFLEAMAAKTPTPGGGSASATAAAMGAGLVAMVVQFSLKRAKTPAQLATLERVLAEVTGLRQRLTALIDEDSAAYEKLRAAFKSQSGVQEATKAAALTPLEIAQCALKVLKAAKALLVIGNPNLLSDAGVAGALAFAAVQGACMNVEINITSLEDRAFKAKLARQTKGLIQQSRLTTIPLLQRVHQRMTR